MCGHVVTGFVWQNVHCTGQDPLLWPVSLCGLPQSAWQTREQEPHAPSWCCRYTAITVCALGTLQDFLQTYGPSSRLQPPPTSWRPWTSHLPCLSLSPSLDKGYSTLNGCLLQILTSSASHRLPFSFINKEVSKATCLCLLEEASHVLMVSVLVSSLLVN